MGWSDFYDHLLDNCPSHAAPRRKEYSITGIQNLFTEFKSGLPEYPDPFFTECESLKLASRRSESKIWELGGP